MDPEGTDAANRATAHPAVTAVVPCYNAAPWIRRCLESILAQTQPVAEIVEVDDGSTDGSMEIVGEYPVRRISFGANRGVAAARNAGLRVASHPLVAHILVSFLRFFHGSNTWDAQHFQLSEHPAGTWRLPPSSARYLRSVLPLYERG